MLFRLDFQSAVPIYRQIRDQVVLAVAQGELTPGERLPTTRALAEDAAQETLLRAWRRYGTFRGEAAERTWITAIALNVCRDLLRSP